MFPNSLMMPMTLTPSFFLSSRSARVFPAAGAFFSYLTVTTSTFGRYRLRSDMLAGSISTFLNMS